MNLPLKIELGYNRKDIFFKERAFLKEGDCIIEPNEKFTCRINGKIVSCRASRFGEKMKCSRTDLGLEL